MVLRDGSTLIHRGPSPRPPLTPGRLSQQHAEGAQKEELDKVIDSLINAVVETIKGTEWPEDSKEAAKGLLDIVESRPEIPHTSNDIPQQVQNVIERYVQVLEDVHIRLKDASSKTGIKNWKIYQSIRSIASKRPNRCSLVFQTCQDDVVQVAKSLRECIDLERSKEVGSGALETSSEEHVQPRAPGTQELGAPLGNTQPHLVVTPPSSTPAPNSPSSGPGDEKARSPIQAEALNVARKTFKAVEIASGSIPVAGTYVAAAAKIGLAFVETIQTMDKNDDLANDLEAQTAKLSKLLSRLTEQPNGDHGELIAGHIAELHDELRRAHDNVTRWESLGRFNKAFHSRDHAELLKDYQGTIQTALEELQLLISLDTRNIAIELRNAEAQEQKRRLLDRLGDGKYGAQGNTIQDVICFPGTRVEILKRIDHWIRKPSSSERVLWIRGMAGRGKSTVASTVVHAWKCRASCAVFHFRRGQNKINSRFICTLARQLGSSLVPEVRNAVLENVRENQDIANERLEEQFKTLFVAPLSKPNGQAHPILIVIDALDECDSLKDAVDFIRLIDRHSPSLPPNIKFLLTCRPEASLVRTLEPKGWLSVDLDTAPDVSEDLERFIRQAFVQIKDSDSDVPTDWPSSADVQRLVNMSQGLFQWARTTIAYVSDGSPVDRLRRLLQRPSMWTGLDDLYHQILSKAFDSVRLDPSRQDLLCQVLGTLIVAPYPVSLDVVASLYDKHEMFEGSSQEYIIQFLRKDILADLNSLLSIPISSAEPMHFMHTSIRDLLASSKRCEQRPYYINPIWYHQQLAKLCFEIMLGDLKENICNLMDASKPSSEIQDVMEREISKAVRYCCRSWSTHLTQGVNSTEKGTCTTTPDLIANFERFSREKVTFWLEIVSMVGVTTEAIGMARHVSKWLLRFDGQSRLESLASLWNDVQRFITTFSEPISFGPLHIYISSLPHCPMETEIWTLYGKYAKIKTLCGVQSAAWPANLWARSVGGGVTAVVFTSDGRTVVSGCDDNTIQLWDTQTGVAVSDQLTGHVASVSSLCFSPNGKVLASGSHDSTIRLWNPEIGESVGEPLAGDSSSVYSVSFSPDSKILACGSSGATIRLWDSRTWTAVGEPLRGHSASVTSICFSPDGKILASGSEDHTIRFWDYKAGAPVGEPLIGHSNTVCSVCFSPEGNLLVSGSDDNTIRLWATSRRTLVLEPLVGHSGGVNSVYLSPDCRLLASGCDDGTIRLWNTQTGAAMGEPLTGHSAAVWSVCFSPDGKLLASGSDDKTVRLWDPQAGAAAAGSLISHRAKVNSVCFSPDGKRVASGYDDGTIRLWDAQTGAAVGERLTGHSGTVNSVCFSPDGNLLASGSDDKTIRLWDVQTGEAKGEPLSGHRRTVRSVCFSPGGNLLASGSEDWTVRLWDPSTGAAVGDPLRGHSDWVESVCFSPDGTYLASGSDDRTILLWDPHTRVAVGEPLAGHSHWVMSVSFSTDGTLLLARCHDGSTATWDIATRQRCDAPRSPPSYANPRFRDHWVTFDSSRFLWLPPQYWDIGDDGVALSHGRLVVFKNGPFSILDVSQILPL